VRRAGDGRVLVRVTAEGRDESTADALRSEARSLVEDALASR